MTVGPSADFDKERFQLLINRINELQYELGIK